MAYPIWDVDNRYVAAGPAGAETIYGFVLGHPSGFWRWHCGCAGGSGSCPKGLSSYYNTLLSAQIYFQSHLEAVHYVVPPPPVLVALWPAIGLVGSNLVTVSGGTFSPTAVVRVSGLINNPTTWLDYQTLESVVSTGGPGVYVITVTDPAYPGYTSNGLQFQAVTVPWITALAPASGPVGTVSVVTVSGLGFSPASVVQLSTINQPTTFVSDTELIAELFPYSIGTDNPVLVIDGPKSSNTINFIGTPP